MRDAVLPVEFQLDSPESTGDAASVEAAAQHAMKRTAMEDDELLASFAGGDEEAFAELYRRLRIDIYRYVLSLTRGNADLAHDVYQETFLKVYEHAHALRNFDNVRGWIFTIARNCCLSHFRRDKRHVHFEMEEAALVDDSLLQPDEALEALDMHNALDQAIACLPDTQRNALILRVFENHSYAEIATKTHTNIGIVRQRLWRAKQSLRSMLAPRFDDGPKDTP